MLFGKKKNNVNSDEVKLNTLNEAEGIYVLGSGCPKCNLLEENLKKALEEMNINEKVFHITDFATIANLGVMSTPALVIDKKIISYGKVLDKENCIKVLKENKK